MSTRVEFPSKNGNVSGALSEPEGGGKVGALVVLQEWHGLTDQMRGKVDRFAKEGYLALCPDLYHGKVATNDQDAGALMNALNFPQAVSEIGDAVKFLRGHARSSGKVGVLGFCMGGALTFLATKANDPLACAVPFYGLPPVPPAEFSGLKTPICAHFAQRDDWAKASAAEEVQKAVRAGGGSMDLYVYEAGHAFMRDGDASKFDAAASKLAWERTLAFLKKHLG